MTLATQVRSSTEDNTDPGTWGLDRYDALAFFSILLGLLIVYGSVILISYAYLDDYFWLDLSSQNPQELFKRLMVQGRPLNGWILQWVFSRARTIAGLRGVRALTIGEMALMGWTFYLAFKRARFDRVAACLLAGLACLVPAMQVYAAWATSVPIPWSGILAITSALLTAWTLDHTQRRWPVLPVVVAMVLASATIYQPTATVFWPVAALDLFRPENRPSLWRRLAVYLAVAGAGLLLAWVVFKFGLAHFPKGYSPHRTGFTHHPLYKSLWFLRMPLVDSLNLFVLRPQLWIAGAMAIVLLLGFLHTAAGNQWARIGAFAVAMALFPLSYLPNLAAEENWSSYRTQIGLSWLVLVLGGLILKSLLTRRGLQALLFTLTLVAASLAAYQVTTLFARPQAQELAELRAEVLRPHVWSAGKIILLQPTGFNALAPYSRYDEFGRRSLESDWVPQSAINLIRRESAPDAPRVPVHLVGHFEGPWTTPLPTGTVLLDMRHLGR